MKRLQPTWVTCFLLILTSFGCTTKRTQVFLGVMTNLSACDGMQKINVRVFGEQDQLTPFYEKDYFLNGIVCPVNPGEVNLPGSFAVSADENKRVHVVVTGTAPGGAGLITRHSTISVIKEKVLFARLALVDECRGIDCGTGRTCIEGVCRTIPTSVGSSMSMGMPLTLAPSAETAGASVFFEQRLLPEITGDNVDEQVRNLATKIECQSGATIAPYRYSDPNPPANAPPGYPVIQMSGAGCPQGSFCEEGLCYQLPAGTMQQVDGGLELRWEQLQLSPETPDGGAPGSYPEGNQATATNNKVVVWGGRDAQGQPLRNTMEIRANPAGSSLSILTPNIGTVSGSVPASELGASTYDSDRDRLVTYRTQLQSGAKVLEYDLEGQSWQEITSELTLPDRDHARIVYDPVRKQTLLFGGTCPQCCTDSANCCSNTALCDTWIYAYDSQYQGMEWKQLTPATKPVGRRDGALVFHQGLGKVVLFGGRRGQSDPPCDPAKPNELYCNDTWLWDGTNWAKVDAPFMGNVVDGVLLYDSLKQQALWMNFPANSPANSPSEIYAFDGAAWSLRRMYEGAPLLAYFSAFFDGPTNSVYVFGGTDDSFNISNLWRVRLP